MVAVKLLDVEFGFFPGAAPDDTFPFLVDVEHHFFGFFSGVPEDAHDDEGDIPHEIDRVVIDGHGPRTIQRVIHVRFYGRAFPGLGGSVHGGMIAAGFCIFKSEGQEICPWGGGLVGGWAVVPGFLRTILIR